MKYRRLIAVLAAVGIVGALYTINNFQTKREIKTTLVYVAKSDIPPHTRITEDMLLAVSEPRDGIPPNAITNKDQIIGKWIQVNYGIPQNGYFFKEKVVDEQALMDAERMKLRPEQQLLTVTVDIERAAAGNVIPDSLVDVWWVSKSTSGKENKVVSGRLFSNVLVVGAKNRNAEDVVNKNTTEIQKTDEKQVTTKQSNNAKELYPTIVQLAVNDEEMQYIRAAEVLGKIYLVPHAGPLVKSVEDIPLSSANENADVDVKAFLRKHMQSTGSATDIEKDGEKE